MSRSTPRSWEPCRRRPLRVSRPAPPAAWCSTFRFRSKVRCPLVFPAVRSSSKGRWWSSDHRARAHEPDRLPVQPGDDDPRSPSAGHRLRAAAELGGHAADVRFRRSSASGDRGPRRGRPAGGRRTRWRSRPDCTRRSAALELLLYPSSAMLHPEQGARPARAVDDHAAEAARRAARLGPATRRAGRASASVRITEQAFDQLLNPIQAKVAGAARADQPETRTPARRSTRSGSCS